MEVAADADALIKLAKSSAKEAVASHYTLVLPPAVREETVDQGKAGGFPDALRIEENLGRGLLRVREPSRSSQTEAVVRGLRLSGGEADVLRLFRAGGCGLVLSDDRRFLQVLEGLGVPFATPGALVAALARRGAIPRKEAVSLLDRLAGFISDEEYSEARRAIEGG